MPVTEGTPPLKRKRAVTSCSECQRRKQKCDRQCPCNNCRARNVANQCVFDAAAMPTAAAGFWDGRPSSSTSPTTGDPGSAGYSLISGSNAFVGLERVLPNEEFQEISRASILPPQSFQLKGNARALVSKLPPAPIINELIDVFFAEVNWHYSIIERFYFDDLFSQWQANVTSPVKYLSPGYFSRELQSYPAVLFQVLALTLQFLPPDEPALAGLALNKLASSQEYSDMGEELLLLVGGPSVTVAAVQARLLRSSWLKNCGRGVEAWHTLGHAIRQAQELGLHRQTDIRQEDQSSVAETLSLIWYDEYKKRLWINLFTWDGLMAMILGRPRMINMDDCDVKSPMDCDIPKDPSRVIPMTTQPRDNHHSITTVSASLFRYELARKFHEMRALKADRPYPKDYSIVRTLHDQVVSLLNEVPPSLRPKNPDTSWDLEYPYLRQQREEILAIHNLFLMALHRPHIITSTESRRAALKSALSTLDSQERFFEQTKSHLYPLFGLAFYTVDASFLLSIIVMLYPLQNQDAKIVIDHALRKAIERLSHIESYNTIAKSGLGILQSCYKKIKETCDSPDNSSSRTISASHQSPDSGLQSIRRDLSIPAAPLSVNGDSNFDFSMPELPNYFSNTYWLQQLDQIQPSLVRPTDPDMFWEYVILD